MKILTGTDAVNIAVFGDTFGIPQLLRYLPEGCVKAVIGASIRPYYLSELKEIAEKLNVPLLVQPKYNDGAYLEFAGNFRKLGVDLLLCNSYSMIIREDILRLVKYNAINVHWALLPKNRGPNPVQWAIIKGERKTGVTLHYMNDGLDNGDVIAQEAVEIALDDTWVSVREKLVKVSDRFLENELPKILEGKIQRVPQNEAEATTNHRLTPESPKIDFGKMTDMDIYNLIRAQTEPLKGAFIECGDKRIYISAFVECGRIKELREKYAS